MRSGLFFPGFRLVAVLCHSAKSAFFLQKLPLKHEFLDSLPETKEKKPRPIRFDFALSCLKWSSDAQWPLLSWFSSRRCAVP